MEEWYRNGNGRYGGMTQEWEREVWRNGTGMGKGDTEGMV